MNAIPFRAARFLAFRTGDDHAYYFRSYPEAERFLASYGDSSAIIVRRSFLDRLFNAAA